MTLTNAPLSIQMARFQWLKDCFLIQFDKLEVEYETWNGIKVELVIFHVCMW